MAKQAADYTMTAAEHEMLAQVAALKLAHRSIFASILFALGEAKTINVEQALTFVDAMASAFKSPFGVGDPMSRRVLELAGEEMAALRPAMLRMHTIPDGAGRA